MVSNSLNSMKEGIFAITQDIQGEEFEYFGNDI